MQHRKIVFGMVLFHMMINETWQFFLLNGSYFDPRVTRLILAVVAAILVLTWGPQMQREKTSEV